MNHVSAFYESEVAEINPYYSMKFDCRSINDVVSFYLGQEGKEHLMLAAACNDCWIRVYDMNEFNMTACLKGVFGAPLCLDLSKDNSLLAAGFEDDSFIIYSLKTNFLPLTRGQAHSSFISQIKFDSYLTDFLSKS